MWGWYCGELDTELAAFAASLRSRCRTAILSNSADGARREEHARYRFADCFDPVLYSMRSACPSPTRPATCWPARRWTSARPGRYGRRRARVHSRGTCHRYARRTAPDYAGNRREAQRAPLITVPRPLRVEPDGRGGGATMTSVSGSQRICGVPHTIMSARSQLRWAALNGISSATRPS